MLCADFKKHTLKFITPGGTSRGVLKTKDSWYLSIWNADNPSKVGIGECSILPGLSVDDRSNYEDKLLDVCKHIDKFVNDFHSSLLDWPSIRFGLEMALLDLNNGGEKIYFPSDFTTGRSSIIINGLIWMGDIDYMKMQLDQKLNSGFNCIKIKVGAIEFNKEIDLIKEIRKSYSVSEIEIRVDANGAFSAEDAPAKLNQLHELGIHSIEQPIKAGQWNEMYKLCCNAALDIALDEELIGIKNLSAKRDLLNSIKPKYIILKPSLLGGFSASEEWIKVAEELGVEWWVTSALEGNIGLNAIAQWTATLNNKLPQGLGTGQVFSNNIDSPLLINKGQLHYNTKGVWGQIP